MIGRYELDNGETLDRPASRRIRGFGMGWTRTHVVTAPDEACKQLDAPLERACYPGKAHAALAKVFDDKDTLPHPDANAACAGRGTDCPLRIWTPWTPPTSRTRPTSGPDSSTRPGTRLDTGSTHDA